MSSKIKGSTPPPIGVNPTIQEKTSQVAQTKASSLSADTFSKNSTPTSYKSPSLIPSAKIFAGEVNFPPHLLDPRASTNDRKYRRLLGAILGFGELEDCFRALEEELDKEDFPFKAVSSEEDQGQPQSQSEEDEEEK